MKLGIFLLISGLLLTAIGFAVGQSGLSVPQEVLLSGTRLGPLELLVVCWPGFVVFGIGLAIGGIIRIIIKRR